MTSPVRPGHSSQPSYGDSSSQDFNSNNNLTGLAGVTRGSSNPYASKAERGVSHKKRNWIIAGVVLLVLAGAGAGIAVWRVGVSNAASSSKSAPASSGSSTPGQSPDTSNGDGTTTTTTSNGTQVVVPSSSLVAIPGTAGAVLSNPNDPSQYQKDPRLHKSFYGLAYSPLNVLEPECGATQANTTEDLQIISQLTSSFLVSFLCSPSRY